MKQAFFLVLLAAFALPSTPAAASAPVAESDVSGTTLTVSPTVAFQTATLRVTGPGGFEAIAWSDGGPLALDLLLAGSIPPSDGQPGGLLAALPDGRYGYEVVLHLAGGGRRTHGASFFVDNGLVRPLPPPPSGERVVAAGGSEGNPIGTRSGSTGDWFAIQDSAMDGTTELRMASTTAPSGVGDEWDVRNVGGDLHLSTFGGGYDDHLAVLPSGNVGIGTTQPQADLHIFRPGGNIRITDSDACPNANAAWEIEEDFGKLKFEVVPNCPGDLVGGKLWIAGTGDLGIGTSAPGDSIHVNRPFPAIRLTDSDPCPISAGSWQIRQALGSLRFGVLTKCSGDPAGTKMTILGNGAVGIGTSAPMAMLHVDGTAVVEGDVAFGSSRTIKHEVEPLDAAAVLGAVRALPLYSWKYREDPVQATHAGPMAEDVHAAFGLGRDEKHLSPADSAGLALAAVQGLDRRLDGEVAALRADNAGLAARNRELLERLAALEARLDRLSPASLPTAAPGTP